MKTNFTFESFLSESYEFESTKKCCLTFNIIDKRIVLE